MKFGQNSSTVSIAKPGDADNVETSDVSTAASLPTFAPGQGYPSHSRVLLFDLLLANYRALVAITDQSTQFRSLELSKSLNAGLGKRLIITDDRMRIARSTVTFFCHRASKK